MKSWIRLLGGVLILMGLVLLGFAGFSYYQVERIASLPASPLDAIPATLPAFGASNLPTPIVYPSVDPDQTSPAILVFPNPLPTDRPATPTITRSASSPSVSSGSVTAPAATRVPVASGVRASQAVKMLIRGSQLKKDIPVREADWVVTEQNGQWTADWNIPYDAAGHHNNTPNPGQVGNVVISGHHNLIGPNQFGVGEFAYFWNLAVGDKLYFLNSVGTAFEYVINASYPVLEQGQPLAVREQHAAQIMGPSDEPIVTLVTCWAGSQNPFSSNTYRWIVVGKLAGKVDVKSIPPTQ